MSRHVPTAALVLAGAVIVAATAAPGADAPLTAINDAEIAPASVLWPNFIADQKGFFTANGVAVTMTFVGGPPAVVQQVVGGSVEFGNTTFDTALRAATNGAPISFVAATAMNWPYSVWVDASIKTAADLKGKKIGLPFESDLLTVIWNRWLRLQGMARSDVDQIYVGSTPNRYAALSSRAVEASVLTQPFDFRAAQSGFHKLVDLAPLAKDFGFLVIVARPQWLKDNPVVAQGYLRALAQSIDWLLDPANKDEATAILAKSVKLDPSFAAQNYDLYIRDLKLFNPGLRFAKPMVESEVKALAEMGDFKSTAKLPADLVNLDYLPK
jgi:NitT/TauT family transport system substrate-binding protein